MSSPATNSSRLLKKINIMTSRPPKPFRVAVLGQNGVGKTAFVVRFVTRRYIGEYDPLLERVYTCQRNIAGGQVDFEVWDTAGINENCRLKEHIRWADAIILMYDVTDRCSFNECSRLKFLVNAHARSPRRRKTGGDPNSELASSVPVSMVGNKKDRDHDRMVTAAEGAERARQLSCSCFQEVSVQEDAEEVTDVLEGLYLTYRKFRKSRSSLAGSLTASKSSLFGGGESAVSGSSRLNGSSSDDDAGVNGSNNSNCNNNNHASVRGNANGNSHHDVSGGYSHSPKGADKTNGDGSSSSLFRSRSTSGISRRITLSAAPSVDLPDEEWIRKARSRRREAVSTIL